VGATTEAATLVVDIASSPFERVEVQTSDKKTPYPGIGIEGGWKGHYSLRVEMLVLGRKKRASFPKGEGRSGKLIKPELFLMPLD
jgi:hypothetical protein